MSGVPRFDRLEGGGLPTPKEPFGIGKAPLMPPSPVLGTVKAVAPSAPLGNPQGGGPIVGNNGLPTAINIPFGSPHEVVYTNDGANDSVIELDMTTNIQKYSKGFGPRGFIEPGSGAGQCPTFPSTGPSELGPREFNEGQPKMRGTY